MFHAPPAARPSQIGGGWDWHQDIELYNSARCAGRNCVMLMYEGEHHAAAQKVNQLDYHRRINAWFDHYLKGEPAQDWIDHGVTALDRKRELKRNEKATTPPAEN